jgi:hypothetical protein
VATREAAGQRSLPLARRKEWSVWLHVGLRYDEAATYAMCAYATHRRRRWQATSCCMCEAHRELYAAFRHMLR